MGDFNRLSIMDSRRIRMITYVPPPPPPLDGVFCVKNILLDVLGMPGEFLELTYWNETHSVKKMEVLILPRTWKRACVNADGSGNIQIQFIH